MTNLEPNRNLTPTLNSDLEQLRENLESARHLAFEAQTQLIGKSAESEALRRTLEKTFEDLAQLRVAIEELRKERHFFANEAMRSAALEIRLTNLTLERDRLASELAATKSAKAQGLS